MIVDARNGNTAWGYRSHGMCAEMAYFLDQIEIGSFRDVSKLIKVSGDELSLDRVAVLVGKVRGDRVFRTRKVDDGIRVWRTE